MTTMRPLFLIATFALALALPAHANLGETIEQTVKRYGNPVGAAEASPATPFGKVMYKAGPFELLLFTIGDKEVGARVEKTDKSAFSSTELQQIMSADTDGSPWKSTTSTDPTCLAWTRNDKATVLYDKEKHVIIFSTPEMEALVHAPPPAAPAPAGTTTTPAGSATNSP